MNSLSVFAFKDYRKFVLAWMEAQTEPWGIVTKMAAAARCQRPYLSKVLKGEAQLTPSQAYGLARFWKLGSSETEYFLGLLESERAGTDEYRQYIERKSQSLRKSYEDLANRVSRDREMASLDYVDYYSAWHWTAIHILVSIPEYQTPEKIARRLSLSPALVQSTLLQLGRYGFIRQRAGRWEFADHERHISKMSPLVAFHHANWRQRATLDAQDPSKNSVHFTVVQSLSVADYERIKQLLIQFIEEASQIAGPSQEEELMCLTCDFFQP